MTESEGGVETTRISRRKAIKLGALGAAGGAAAWLLPGTAGAGRSLTPPGICARGSGDVCGRQIRQCGISKPGGIPNGELCVCAADSRTPATHCVEDRIDERVRSARRSPTVLPGCSASSAASTSASIAGCQLGACSRRARSASSSRSSSASAPGRATRARPARTRTSATKAVWPRGLPSGALLCSRSSV